MTYDIRYWLDCDEFKSLEVVLNLLTDHGELLSMATGYDEEDIDKVYGVLNSICNIAERNN